MGDLNAGMEASAIAILKRAIELDKAGRLMESLIRYQEGVEILIGVLKNVHDEKKKQNLRERISEYIGRAEVIKKHVDAQKADGQYHEQRIIKDGSTGNDYASLLGPYLVEACEYAEVDDPYIRSTHQVYNFLRLCEVFVKAQTSLKRLVLVTGSDKEGTAQQQQLKAVAESLQQHGVTLDVRYSDVLHDREMRMSSGWIVKIGRGLDYFKPPDSKFSIGYCDYALRRCHETTVDIFHSLSVPFKYR